MRPSPRKKRRATVGHISVPDLPGYWPGRLPADSAAHCADCHRRDHTGKTYDEHEAYCRSPGHDQLDCECEDPFTCI